ncbi:MAG: hypothetical protein ACHQAX_10000 [Gammaproteobacteria bacterium]
MKNIIFIILGGLLLAGCTSKDDNKNDDKYNDLENTILSELIVIEERVEELEKQVDELQWKHVAILTPTQTQAWPITTNEGLPFMLQLDKIVKYANGYKATIRIGNPAYVTYDDIKLNVSWGKNGQMKTNEFRIFKTILPGSWNIVDIILSPAKEADIELIAVKVLPENFSLFNDTRKDRR